MIHGLISGHQICTQLALTFVDKTIIRMIIKPEETMWKRKPVYRGEMNLEFTLWFLWFLLNTHTQALLDIASIGCMYFISKWKYYYDYGGITCEIEQSLSV